MSLFLTEKRNKSDIDEIFSCIYTDLTSIHPSNEYLGIFLQYFRPLFDLTLGVACFNGKITSTNYLSDDAKDALKQQTKSLRNNFSRITLCTDELPSTVKSELSPFIEECSSCMYIPILIEGCSDRQIKPSAGHISLSCRGNENDIERKKKRLYNKHEGSFILLPRLKNDQFKDDGCHGNNFFDYVLRHVTASFLQQSARYYYLLNTSELQHTCYFKDQKSVSCETTKGIGPLNKAGEALCKNK